MTQDAAIPMRPWRGHPCPSSQPGCAPPVSSSSPRRHARRSRRGSGTSDGAVSEARCPADGRACAVGRWPELQGADLLPRRCTAAGSRWPSAEQRLGSTAEGNKAGAAAATTPGCQRWMCRFTHIRQSCARTRPYASWRGICNERSFCWQVVPLQPPACEPVRSLSRAHEVMTPPHNMARVAGCLQAIHAFSSTGVDRCRQFPLRRSRRGSVGRPPERLTLCILSRAFSAQLARWKCRRD
jgi:hypothetical protein